MLLVAASRGPGIRAHILRREAVAHALQPPAEMSPKAKNLLQRLATAAVLLPPVVWLLWRGGWPAAALSCAASALAAFEFDRLVFGKVSEADMPGLVVAAVLPALPLAAGPHAGAVGLWLLVITSVSAWAWHVLRQDIAGADHAPLRVQGVVFCALGPYFLSALGAGPGGARWVLTVVAASFANDALAFGGGSLFGRHRLAPKVSPGKTWEGLGAGALGSLAAAVTARAIWPRELGWGDVAAVTLISATLGPLGDLMKSVLKRSRGVKDAGKLLPGHGGMLDRIDALLVNAPAIWAWVHWAR